MSTKGLYVMLAGLAVVILTIPILVIGGIVNGMNTPIPNDMQVIVLVLFGLGIFVWAVGVIMCFVGLARDD